MMLTYYKGYAIQEINGLWRLVLSPYEFYSSLEAIRKQIDILYDKSRLGKEVQKRSGE